jgi:hypothetical protein
MLAAVHQHVDESISDRPQRRECPGVIAIAPHGAAASERTIDGPRDTNGETANTADESVAVVRLRDQVQVIVLNAEVDDAEAVPRSHGKGTADRRKDAGGPQAGDCRTGAQRDVHRMSRDM